MPNGRARQFTFPMGVKSVITAPCGGQTIARSLSDLWCGVDRRRAYPPCRCLRRRREDVGSFSLVRSCAAEGAHAVSHDVAMGSKPRGPDESGNRRNRRRAVIASAIIAARGPAHRYHYHAIASWSCQPGGEVRNVDRNQRTLTARFACRRDVGPVAIVIRGHDRRRQTVPAHDPRNRSRRSGATGGAVWRGLGSPRLRRSRVADISIDRWRRCRRVRPSPQVRSASSTQGLPAGPQGRFGERSAAGANGADG